MIHLFHILSINHTMASGFNRFICISHIMGIFSWVFGMKRTAGDSPNSGSLIKRCNHAPASALKRTQNLDPSSGESSSWVTKEAQKLSIGKAMSEMTIAGVGGKTRRGKEKVVAEDEVCGKAEEGLEGVHSNVWEDGHGVHHQDQHLRISSSIPDHHDYAAITHHHPSSSSILHDLDRSTRQSHIVFFDLETTVASGRGDKPKLLEFGAVVLASQGLREIQSYTTLIRHPGIFSMSSKFNLAPHRIICLPYFDDVADRIFDILHGRIWAGHNIIKWDMVWIKDAFEESGRKPPEPVGVIDTLPLLRESFGPRAGNFKLESLAKYCGLGKQKHRSLADVRMNMDVLKSCATILFLESRFPHILNGPIQPTTRSSTRSLGFMMEDQVASKEKPKWEQVIRRPSVRLTREMKRASPIRIATLATTSSNNNILRRQIQLGQNVRTRTQPLRP